MARPASCDRDSSAFSLVEIVLAMGLFVFAFVAMLGLLVTALHAGREAHECSVAAHLGNRVAGEIRSLPFAEQPPAVRYFDFDGHAVSSPETAHFQCTITPLAPPAEWDAPGTARKFRLDWTWPLHARSPRTLSQPVTQSNPDP
jgi:hypothetical protein